MKTTQIHLTKETFCAPVLAIESANYCSREPQKGIC